MYHDPYVPDLVAEGINLVSVPLTDEVIAGADIVCVATGHGRSTTGTSLAWPVRDRLPERRAAGERGVACSSHHLKCLAPSRCLDDRRFGALGGLNGRRGARPRPGRPLSRERGVDRLDHPDDVEPELGRRARRRRRADRPAEVGHLEEQRLGGRDVRRDDVAGAVGEPVLAEGLRVRERRRRSRRPAPARCWCRRRRPSCSSRRSSSGAACWARARSSSTWAIVPERVLEVDERDVGGVGHDAAAADAPTRASASRRASSAGSRSRAGRDPRRR